MLWRRTENAKALRSWNLECFRKQGAIVGRVRSASAWQVERWQGCLRWTGGAELKMLNLPVNITQGHWRALSRKVRQSDAL